MDALEGEGDDFAGVDGLSGLADETGEFLGPDVFFESFYTAFCMASLMPPCLQSLAVDPKDEAARKASDALYEIILETPSMHFIIQPGGKWFKRLSAIALFAVPKSMAVAGEIKMRKAIQHQQAQQTPRTEKPAKGDQPETSMPSGDPMGWAPKSEAA